jgi:hydroxyacylglutathione hydrolase
MAGTFIHVERFEKLTPVRKGFAKMIIKQILIGPYEVFTYIVACPRTGEAAIIDPAGEAEGIADLLVKEKLKTKYILDTHGHADHILASGALSKALSVPVCMHEADVAFFSQGDNWAKISQELGLSCSVPVDKKLKDGEELGLGTLKIEVIHTPGHTPGSVCFLVKGNLFTGDTLFVGAAGRTDLTGGSLVTLLESIEKKLLVLPQETVVWPGHHYGETPASTIGREMEENIYITDFILDT